MQIFVTGRHFEVTNLIRANAESKAAALFDRYPTLKVSSVRITMELDKNRRAKVNVFAALKKQLLSAEARELDLYTAMDSAFAKLQSQLEHYVDKYKRPEATPPVRDIAPAQEPAQAQA